MKNIKFYLVVIMFILSVSVYATDVCSKSYDSSGNMRLRAGLEIDGNITWSNPAAWYFTDENGKNHFYPGNDPQYSDSGVTYEPWTLTSQEVTWPCNGRWFVTMNHTPYSNDHYGVGREQNKSMKSAVGHDLSLMFSDGSWVVDSKYTSSYDEFSYTTGAEGQYTRPAGKFCTFKVRVTDNTKGDNERYYWIGDTSTGYFKHYQEFTGENFVLLPEYGRFGEYGEAIWYITAENLEIYINVSTIYDQARFGIDISNAGDTTKYVSLAMCGTPATSDNPSAAWGHKPYVNWTTKKKDPKSLTFELGGWDVTKQYCSSEMDPVFMYLKGIGTIQKALIISGKAVPDTMEMFSYRYDTSDVANDPEAMTRFDNSELDAENCDTTYNLPPKSSYINENIQYIPYKNQQVPDRVASNDTAFFSVAQATFENNGDAVKPDYLIIDKSSNMLDFDKRGDTYYYPFGYMINETPISMVSGDFPTTHIWPKKEAGVKNPYEDTIESSHAWPYVDQFYDPLSYMAIWGQEAIAKNKTRNIVTYFGLGGKSFINGKLEGKTFTRQSHSLLVESPDVLSYQVTKDEFGSDTLKPTKFVIKPIVVNQAYVKNIYDFYIKQIKISLPNGLIMDDDTYDGDGNYFELSDDPDDPENTYFVDKNILLGKLGVYENMSINVNATGDYSGDLTYTITLVGQDKSETKTWTQSVSRSILVPTTKSGFYYGGPGNLLGNPFKNVDTSGEGTSNPFTIADVYKTDAYGFVWNANTQKYESISDLDTLRNIPQGYWVLKSVDEDSVSNKYEYTFPTFTKPNDVNYGDVDINTKYYMSEVNIALAKGWNIVSNPYIYPMQWVNVYVKNKTTNKLLSMQDAISEGWISKTLYSYEPNKVTTTPSTGYVGYSTDATLLFPNKGYWIYAYKPVQLYFSNMIYPDAKIYDDDYYTDPDKYFKFGYSTDEDYGIEEEE